MWTIIKIDKKKIELLKKDFQEKLGGGFAIYSPKLSIKKYKKNKLINNEFHLLGNYLFCFHKNFKSIETVNKLKFTIGLKYFLGGFIQSQDEIKKFIEYILNKDQPENFTVQNRIQD